MSAAEMLRAARKRIEDPDHWTTGVIARNRAGDECDPDSPAAARWCALGSIWCERKLTLRSEDTDLATRFLEEAACEIRDTQPELVAKRSAQPVEAQVNDELGHEATLRMYDRAIELAEAAAK